MKQETDLPPTFCDTCRRAEMTPVGRLIDSIRSYFHVPSAAEIIADQARWMASVLSGPSASPYERHRELYAQNGDEIEKTRMLRHVKTP